MAICPATAAGWLLGRLMVPVPSLIRLMSFAIKTGKPARRYILRLVGDVLPAIGFGETQFVSQDKSLSVFL